MAQYLRSTVLYFKRRRTGDSARQAERGAPLGSPSRPPLPSVPCCLGRLTSWRLCRRARRLSMNSDISHITDIGIYTPIYVAILRLDRHIIHATAAVHYSGASGVALGKIMSEKFVQTRF